MPFAFLPLTYITQYSLVLPMLLHIALSHSLICLYYYTYSLIIMTMIALAVSIIRLSQIFTSINASNGHNILLRKSFTAPTAQMRKLRLRGIQPLVQDLTASEQKPDSTTKCFQS